MARKHWNDMNRFNMPNDGEAGNRFTNQGEEQLYNNSNYASSNLHSNSHQPWKRGISKSSFYDDKHRNRRQNWNQWNDDNVATKTNASNYTDRPRNRHPPGLKGREIGMWYAKFSSRNSSNLTTAPSLRIGEKTVKDLNEALNKLQNEYTVPSTCSADRLRESIDESDGPSYIKKENEISYDISPSSHTSAVGSVSKMKMNDFPLLRNEIHDLQYHDELVENMLSHGYKKMLNIRKQLPSYTMKEEILHAISMNQVIVLSGETGCGKTTQVGQFILDDFILNKKGSTCHIICTQPRRLSTLAVSQRVAEERNETLGTSVGYQIRLESKIPRGSGSILFCTTGIVLQRLITNSSLSSVSHVILDEIHERDTDSDFLMCIIKNLMILRSDIKVILMSATLNAKKFSQYFGNCPMIHIPGFTYMVKEYYLEDALQVTNFKYGQDFNQAKKFSYQKYRRPEKEVEEKFYDMIDPYIRSPELQKNYSPSVIQELHIPESEELNLNLILELLRYISRQPPGAVLIFVPGWDSISKLNKLIEDDRYFNFNDFLVIPLHSLMPTSNQQKIFDKPPAGKRKVVIATSIAETSITINDIIYVIDSGKTKMRNYDKDSHINTLSPQWVSLANAKQRRGRAGRVQEGICYHLYSRAREMILDQYPLPEIQRTRLEEVILKIKILQLGPCKYFLSKLMDTPDESIIDASLQMLTSINALDSNEELTPLGMHLARLPMDPLIGKMLLMSTIFSCVNPILTIAAMLSFKDPFVIALGQESAVDRKRVELSGDHQSDHLMYAQVYNGWERSLRFQNDREYTRANFLSPSVLKQTQNMRKQLLGILYDNNFIDTKDPHAKAINHNAHNTNLVKAVITAGLYPNVGRLLKKQGGRNHGYFKSIRLPGNLKAHFHLKSVNEKQQKFHTDWVVYWEKLKTTKMYLFDSTAVSLYPLLLFGQNFNYNEAEGVVHVDEFVKCSCPKDVALVMEKLRRQLNEILQYRIANPKTTDWAKSTKEKQFLSIVVKVLNEY